MRGHDIQLPNDSSPRGNRRFALGCGAAQRRPSTTILALASLLTTYRSRATSMSKTVILGSARTPIAKMGGGLSSLDATELGGLAINAALERAGVEPEQVEHVVMGQVLQAD